MAPLWSRHGSNELFRSSFANASVAGDNVLHFNVSKWLDFQRSIISSWQVNDTLCVNRLSLHVGPKFTTGRFVLYQLHKKFPCLISGITMKALTIN